MTQRVYITYFTGTPTEHINLTGETESGRHIEAVILESMALDIIVNGSEAYKHCKHVGHALWHVKNNKMSKDDFKNCTTCKYSMSEYRKNKKK